jgi:hypothetical protein
MRFRRDFASVPGILTLVLLLAADTAWAGGRSGGHGGAVQRSAGAHHAGIGSQARSVQRGDGHFESHTTRTGPRGGTRTKDVVGQRTEDGRTRSTTWTDAQGRTASREATVTRDPAAGTRTRDVVLTGRDGQTRTRSTTVERTENGHTSATVLTDAQGNVATRDASVTRDPETGTRTRQVEWTGRDGQTASRTSVTQRTDDGRTTTSTSVRPDGTTITREYTVSRDGGGAD